MNPNASLFWSPSQVASQPAEPFSFRISKPGQTNSNFSGGYMHNLSAGPAWPSYNPLEQQRASQAHSPQPQALEHQQHHEESSDFKSQYQYQPIYQQSFPIGLQQVEFHKRPHTVTKTTRHPLGYPQSPAFSKSHNNPTPVQPPVAPPLPTTFNTNSNYLSNQQRLANNNTGSNSNVRRGSTGMANSPRGYNNNLNLVGIIFDLWDSYSRDV